MSAEVAFVVAREAARGRERIGVLVRAEQAIPDRQVGEVVAVDVDLVMNRVQLRRLDEVLEPARRLEVGVIEVLAGRGEEVVPERSLQRDAEQRVEDQRAQRRSLRISTGCL